MAERKGFYPEIRLACQTRVVDDNDGYVDKYIGDNLMKDFYELKRSFEFELKGKTKKVKAHEISVYG